MALYDAYIFDVQGTLLDFFTPVATAIADHLGCPHDDALAGDITRAWRRDYFDRIAKIEQTAHNWNPVQDAYAAGLNAVCTEFGLSIPESDHPRLAQAWKQLVPWVDVPDGLRRIRSEAIVASLSNTDMSTMVGLFKDLGMNWDAILTAEVFGAFKPEPFVYQRTCRYIGTRPERTAMVASHPYDLRAARAEGLKTIFVYRPDEFGRVEDAVDDADGEFDHRVDDIRTLP